MRLYAIAILFLISLVACNLGTPDPTPQRLFPTPTLPTSQTNLPTVTVNSPQNGAEFPVNQPIFVSATANSNQGVTRVQLFANGVPVKTVSSVSAAGDTTLNAALDYTPRALGLVNLRVLAFRGADASAPVDLQVNIVNQTGQPTALPTANTGGGGGNSGSGNVYIPPDGVCRVLTNNAVNFRSAPTTAVNNILNTLSASTLAPVVARLGDNSWWKVSVNGQVGWVFGNLVTITGNCFSIPIEAGLTPTPAPSLTPLPPTNTPVPVGPTATPVTFKPDLIVANIFGNTSLVLSGSSVTETYSVTISNVGLGNATQFTATISVNGGAALDLGTVSGLDKSQSVVLQRALTFNGPGTYQIRVDVDTANQVSENSDINNRGDVTVTVTS